MAQGRAGPRGGMKGRAPPPAALVRFEEVGVGLQEVEAVIHQETAEREGGEVGAGGGGGDRAGGPRFHSPTALGEAPCGCQCWVGRQGIRGALNPPSEPG